MVDITKGKEAKKGSMEQPSIQSALIKRMAGNKLLLCTLVRVCSTMDSLSSSLEEGVGVGNIHANRALFKRDVGEEVN